MEAAVARCGMVASFVFAAVLVLGPLSIGYASAAEKDAVQFSVNMSMTENLTALKGKTVTVHLASGQALTGTINDVKGNLLHLVKLSQKDFYDALVAIDRISAVEMKAR